MLLAIFGDFIASHLTAGWPVHVLHIHDLVVSVNNLLSADSALHSIVLALGARCGEEVLAWAATEPLASLIECETTPGPEAESDEAILACMDRYGTAGLHTVGSCRMGKDEASVVDSSLRVRGMEGLRVIDASVFPVIPAGNTNAPVLALAWLASDMIERGG